METNVFNTLRIIVTAAVFSSLLSPQPVHADYYRLVYCAGVPLVQQYASNWCWAASAQAILARWGIFLSGQCRIADMAWGAEADCCSNPFSQTCNQTNYLSGTDEAVQMILTSLSVGTYYMTGILNWDSTNPSETTVTTEINYYKPFIAGIDYYDPYGNSAGGHDVVVYGYEHTFQGDNNILYMDPERANQYWSLQYPQFMASYNSTNQINELWTETLMTASMPWPACDASDPPQSVCSTSAILGGSVNPKGLGTTVYIDWGTSSSYGNSPAVAQISGTTFVPVSLSLSGLAPNTTYHYRIRAVNQYTTTSRDMTFTTPPGFTLTVTKKGTGSGTVTSSPAGISCGSTCSAASNSYTTGTAVTLTPTPDRGKIFTGWSGACSGRGSCTVTMNSAQSVSATFVPDITPILNLLLSD